MRSEVSDLLCFTVKYYETQKIRGFYYETDYEEHFYVYFSKTSVFTMNYTPCGWEPFWDLFGTGRGQWQSRAEPGRDGPGRAEPGRAEPSRAEQSRAGPGRAEPSRAGPSRAEPSRAIQRQSEKGNPIQKSWCAGCITPLEQ